MRKALSQKESTACRKVPVLSTLQTQAMPAEQLVYISTQGSGGPPGQKVEIKPGQVPPPQGIYAAVLDSETGQLTPRGIQAVLESASFMIQNPRLPVIYTATTSLGGKLADSDIISYRVDPETGKLFVLNVVKAGGKDANHLDIDSASMTLFSANYESSNVTAFSLREDGKIGNLTSTIRNSGNGPHPRQKKAEPHGVTVDLSHQYVLCSDFGADHIFVYKFDQETKSLSWAKSPCVKFPPGTAPRHLVFNPDGRTVYAITELSAEIQTYTFDHQDGSLQLIQTIETYPTDWKDRKSGAEIKLSKGGKYLYASLRYGLNTLVVYSIKDDDHSLIEIQRIESQGDIPWSFDLDQTGQWMIVTNTRSNTVSVLKIDPSTGKLQATDHSLEIPRPWCAMFFSA